VKRYFCFLRAINVGGHTVTMQQLGKIFESIGLSDVETFIASGNVIFNSSHRNSDSVEQLVSKRLKDELGYDVHAFVRTREELQAVESFEPFSREKIESAMAYHVGFAAEPPSKEAVAKIAAFSSDLDDLRAEGREIYWIIRTRFSDSKVSSAAIERSFGARVTFRNINTVRRLLGKYPPSPKSTK